MNVEFWKKIASLWIIKNDKQEFQWILECARKDAEQIKNTKGYYSLNPLDDDDDDDDEDY